MKKENIYGAIIFALFILCIILIFIYRTNQVENHIAQLNNEHPHIEINEKLNAVISNISHGNPEMVRNSPHHAFVTLDGELQKRIAASYELNQELTLDEVLEVGDRFVKESGKGRFYIYKIELNDTLIYEFELQYN